MIKHIKKFLYAVAVIVGVCSAHAGSYDDYFTYIRNDNAGAVEGLLERGFDPNTRDPKGQPGLIIAMQERSLKAARALLARPATDVNALNQAGESALMMAALKGDIDAVRLLLDRGAAVNLTGWSPVHYAAIAPDTAPLRLLLERGADINAASPNGTTPLMMAAQYGSEDNVSVLLARGADPRRRNQRDLGVVDFAKLSGREPLVRRLEAMLR